MIIDTDRLIIRALNVKRMYKDINDENAKMYHFYEVKK